MLALVLPGQFYIPVACPLRLFDKGVKQDHSSFVVNVEKHSGDAILRQVRSHFIYPVTHRPANGHPDGPAKFDGLNVLADAFTVVGREALQPISHGFVAGFCAEKDCRQSLAFFFWIAAEPGG